MLGVEHILGGIDHLLFVLALLTFNVGVEIGQLLLVAAALAAGALVTRLPLRAPSWGAWVPPYPIGTVAMFWVIERVAAY